MLEALPQLALRAVCADPIEEKEIVKNGISQARSIAYTLAASLTAFGRLLHRPFLADSGQFLLHCGLAAALRNPQCVFPTRRRPLAWRGADVQRWRVPDD